MFNTEIRLFIFFAAKDGEAVYIQHKQDLYLTVAQIITCPVLRRLPTPWGAVLGAPAEGKPARGLDLGLRSQV